MVNAVLAVLLAGDAIPAMLGSVGLFGLAVPVGIARLSFRGPDVDYAGISLYGRME